MKNIKESIARSILIIALMLLSYSCNKELEIDPLNILTDTAVFNSPDLIEAYVVSLYDRLPTDEFNVGMMKSTDLAMSYLGNAKVEGTSDGTWFGYWGYESVRLVNDFLQKLPTANISDGEKIRLEGEAKFIRAFYYFGMVKRYGGIPIVKDVKEFVGVDLSELQVPRDKEMEVWDFIAEDLDDAASKLPPEVEQGRANKYAALALKSRAMLYAASIATYGSEQLNGVLGIPKTEKDRFWKASFDAAKLIIESNNYSLYAKNSDKAVNFSELFIEKDNPEAILRKFYSYPQKTHGFDAAVLPFAVRIPGGDGSQVGPTLEFVEQFEYTDGSSGELRLENPDGTPIYYKNATDLFLGKDPRCLGTIIVPYSIFKETTIEVRSGIYDNGIKVDGGLEDAKYNIVTKTIDPNGTVPVHGNCGLVSSLLESTQTGFYLRKYLDYTKPQSQNQSVGHFILFRYGEVLLNYAEAAVQLNNVQEAKWAINEIRDRAGIKLLDDIEITVDKVRHERLVELSFESHRWWDLRRWRIADKVLNNSYYSQLLPYWDIQEEAYRFEKRMLTERLPKTFVPRVYYERINDDILDKNPNFIPNPGY